MRGITYTKHSFVAVIEIVTELVKRHCTMYSIKGIRYKNNSFVAVKEKGTELVIHARCQMHTAFFSCSDIDIGTDLEIDTVQCTIYIIRGIRDTMHLFFAEIEK
jgi:16S rRNA G1207 methylase RsmC